ncbi:PAS domain S-box protein [Rhodohalobacter sp. SW132]|uniref:PAS domain S-box protein n=1 Tax=Rhodohalobacter sp. SW132 TaxID=2293433 RepID=UPI000E267F02|nr:PAS domain S-box protein [Rhodohalobacter sp. SW132]REL39038.1 PAS domain S-box protein [Rhodohalobacter sp. SW132]
MGKENPYLSIFQSLPQPAVLIRANSPDFEIADANEAFIQLSGKSREELIGHRHFDIFPDNPADDEYNSAENLKKLLDEVIRTGEPNSVSIQRYDLFDKESGTFQKNYYHPHHTPIFDEENNVEFILQTVREISGQTQQDMRKNEARFRALVERGNDVLFILSPEGKPSYVSPTVEKILGYTQKEALGLDMMNSIHPDDMQHVGEELQLCMEHPGKPIEVTPARMKHKDGSWRWFTGTITNMLHDPDINGIVDNFREITEQVAIKQRLNQTEELYQSLIQTLDGISWEADAETFLFSYVSPQSKEILGYSPEEWLADPEFWQNHIHPNEVDHVVSYCKSESKEGRNHDFEYRMRSASGEYVWLKDVVTVIHEDGKPSKLRGIMIDITDRKREELAKLAEREKYRSIFENSLVAFFVSRPDGTILEANPMACTLFGYTVDEFREIGRQGFIDPKSPGLKDKLEERDAKGRTKGELYGIHKNGTRIPCEFSSVVFQDNSGDILNTVMMVDISDRKYFEESMLSANEKLKNTVDRYEIVSRATSDTIWDFELSGDQMIYNDNIHSMFGYDMAEVSNMASWWRDKIHPDDLIHVSQQLRSAIAYRKNRFQMEYRFRTADGSFKHIYDRAFLIKDDEGEPQRMIGAMQDVTSRVKEQEQLKLMESVITNTNESVVITEAEPNDLPGRKVLYVNQAFTEMTGYPEDEVVGSTLGFLNGPKTDQLKIEELRESMRRYETSDIEIINYRKNGDPFWLFSSSVPVQDRDGKYTHWVFIGRDISEQKIQEKNILDSLKEKETLLAEVHHRVKNNLAVVSSLMEIQAMNSSDPELNNQLMSNVMRIKSIAAIHEQLYKSNSFSRLRFAEGLERLVNSIVNTMQFDVDISLIFQLEEVELSINQGLPCSLIVNEIITNILKHGYKGRKTGKITIILQKNGDNVTLQIEDDGIGLPENFDRIDGGSMGLQLIDLLTEQLKGKKTYSSSSEGTLFTLKFSITDAKGSGSSFIR